jgi:hypothetical protein
VGFEGGEAVAEVGRGAVEGCAEEVTHRGDGGAKSPADFALEDVELRVAASAELEGEKLAYDESYDAGWSLQGCREGNDEGCSCGL